MPVCEAELLSTVPVPLPLTIRSFPPSHQADLVPCPFTITSMFLMKSCSSSLTTSAITPWFATQQAMASNQVSP